MVQLFHTPAGVAIIKFSDTDRVIFVVDEGWHRIVYSREGGDWIKVWGEYGTQLLYFLNILFHKTGTIFSFALGK